MDKVQARMNFKNGIYADRRNQGGDLALFWKESINLKGESFSIGHIDTVITNEKGKTPWRFTGFYGNPVTNHRSIHGTFSRDLQE